MLKRRLKRRPTWVHTVQPQEDRPRWVNIQIVTQLLINDKATVCCRQCHDGEKPCKASIEIFGGSLAFEAEGDCCDDAGQEAARQVIDWVARATEA